MGWNHRILVTFDENNIPTSYTKESISVGAETLKGMKWVLKHMKKCLKNQYYMKVIDSLKNIK